MRRLQAFLLMVSLLFIGACNNAEDVTSEPTTPTPEWVQLTEVQPYPEGYDPDDYEDYTDEDLVNGPSEDRVGDTLHRQRILAEQGTVKVVTNYRGPIAKTVGGPVLTVFRDGSRVYRTKALSDHANVLNVTISPTTDDIWVVAYAYSFEENAVLDTSTISGMSEQIFCGS